MTNNYETRILQHTVIFQYNADPLFKIAFTGVEGYTNATDIIVVGIWIVFQ